MVQTASVVLVGAQLLRISDATTFHKSWSPTPLRYLAEEVDAGSCFAHRARYWPLSFGGHLETVEGSAEACQARCVATAGCAFFTFFPDGACEVHDSAAQQESLPLVDVVSGPRTCGTVQSAADLKPPPPPGPASANGEELCVYPVGISEKNVCDEASYEYHDYIINGHDVGVPMYGTIADCVAACCARFDAPADGQIAPGYNSIPCAGFTRAKGAAHDDGRAQCWFKSGGEPIPVADRSFGDETYHTFFRSKMSSINLIPDAALTASTEEEGYEAHKARLDSYGVPE
eukprot:SAG31_NODE_11410_length_1034_cov_0.734759_1_plen_287_part_10